MRFRKKPVVVEAVMFDGNNGDELSQFVGQIEFRGSLVWGFQPAALHEDRTAEGVTAEVYDKLHDTWVGVKPNQWIIRGVQGEFYPCDHDVFTTTYERVEETS